MKINLFEIVSHCDFKCSKSQKKLRDNVLEIVDTISCSRPSDTENFQTVINLLSLKITKKKYSLQQLRIQEKNWLKTKVIKLVEEEDIKEEGGEDYAEVMQNECSFSYFEDEKQSSTKKVCWKTYNLYGIIFNFKK